ncbi:DUF2231 domain-containing protein [Microbacterium testaceum]|uniref:DUF2231 domain-containing protein n=1 Tax=Microbacterium testaceum TaxID=2033 RepID=A0A2T7WGR6_MICTE|nr:DUF2231 domain-containing protein [Microbacterium testaceum]PVE70465.1 hypothetical protein DC432_10290 [Microbacterium testaceum]
MWQIAGLPAHPLLVHAVVVLIPLAALMVVLGSVWPAARRRLGILTPIVALVALIFVPLAKEAGEALERQVPESAVLERHTELGDQLLPWAIGLFVVAAGQWVWFRVRDRRAPRSAEQRAAPGRSRVLTLVIAVVAVAVSVGTTVSVVQVGDSGARAVWSSDTGGTPSGGDDG